jgi:hypothetical protein
MRDALERFHIRSCVRDALSRHGIEHDSPLRAQLEANATIAGGTDSYVVMKNGNSLDAEIENWGSSPRPLRASRRVRARWPRATPTACGSTSPTSRRAKCGSRSKDTIAPPTHQPVVF